MAEDEIGVAARRARRRVGQQRPAAPARVAAAAEAQPGERRVGVGRRGGHVGERHLPLVEQREHLGGGDDAVDVARAARLRRRRRRAAAAAARRRGLGGGGRRLGAARHNSGRDASSFLS